MIREALELAYKKSIGTLTDWFMGLVASVTRGSGLMQGLYVLIVVVLMAGFVNALVYPLPNQTYIPYPNGSGQTVPESVVNAFVIATGGAGIYVTYLSGRQTVKPRAVNLYLGIALLLLIVSIFTGIDMAILKGFG